METQLVRTLQKKRTTNFREDETKLLIQLWGSPQIQNKLYLTHRKAPVMRLLAANMQHRGFYRTPDEIKTRIRNLKCLYHRIKRSTQTGVGIGTVDPDWPHYKAMDDILSKRNQKATMDLYKDNVFDGPRCEDIKQEIIDDIDINDDMDSYTNSMNESDNEFEEEPQPMPGLTPKPLSALQNPRKEDTGPVKIAPKPIQPAILPNQMQIPIQANIRPNNAAQSLPFPLLILNGLPNGVNNGVSLNKSILQENKSAEAVKDSNKTSAAEEKTVLISNLLDVQKEHLHVEKQRLKLEKQKFKLLQLVGTQMLILLPALRNYLHKQASSDREGSSGRKRKKSKGEDCPDDLSEGKILKTVLEEGIKKYMMDDSDDDDDEDSGIHNVNDEREKK